MTGNTTCRDAFNAAQERRTRVPLRAGLYKIREAMAELDRMADTVGAIAHRFQSRKGFQPNEPLGGCSSDDKDAYVLAIPLHIADSLGYDMLPGVEALGGDGWPQDMVANAIELARSEVRYVLGECERVHTQLRKNLAGEYGAMTQGQSELLSLLRKAEIVGLGPLQLDVIVNEASPA
jgi:hypothetical protein